MVRLGKLGPRKDAIIALVPQCARGAEIGADHGQISAGILQAGRCKQMLVCDISAASLRKARRLFASLGWEEQAAFAEADGLEAIETPVDAIVIAGMGAKTMTGILERGLDRIGDAALVLQANPGPEDLRAWLCAHGFRIEAETLVYDEGRYYIALRAVKGAEPLTERQTLLGPRLLENRTPLFESYLQHKLDCARVGLSDRQKQRAEMIEQTLKEGKAE